MCTNVLSGGSQGEVIGSDVSALPGNLLTYESKTLWAQPCNLCFMKPAKLV